MHPRLVDDLIPLILDSEDNWWTSDLLSFSLVSRAWLEFVRKRLYRHPQLRSFRACAQLTESLHSTPQLEDHISGLDIQPSAEGTVDMSSVRCLLSLRNVQSLKLGGRLAVQAERCLHLVANPQSITSLHIDGGTSELCSSFLCTSIASLEWDETLAFKFHNLHSLHLSKLELEVVSPSMPYQISLTSLSMDEVSVNGRLSWLAHRSWNSLANLTILTSSESELSSHVKEMVACCRNMRRLQYEVNYRAGPQDPIFDGDLQPCPSIREVALGGRLDYALLGIITQCCPSLEALIISGRPAVSPDQWVTFLESDSAATLKELSTPWFTYTPPFQFRWSAKQLGEVQDACRERGIRLF
jgi:hypothetical protein